MVLIVVYVPEGRVASVRDVSCSRGVQRRAIQRAQEETVPLPWAALGAGSPMLPAGGCPRAEMTRVNDGPEGCEQSSMLTFNVTFEFI